MGHNLDGKDMFETTQVRIPRTPHWKERGVTGRVVEVEVSLKEVTQDLQTRLGVTPDREMKRTSWKPDNWCWIVRELVYSL